MDTILAKRNLAKEKNNAQTTIDVKIQRMATTSSKESEFVIPMLPIQGDINLSKLRPLNVRSIVTKESGYITDVFGIPEGVKNVKFEKQLLVEVPQLPDSLETLDLTGNYIEKVDLSELNNLKVLKLNNNRIKSIGKNDLPTSLEELYVDNNQIALLNLSTFDRLRILHCRNNRMMRIENIPASLVDLQVEDGNPNILLDYAFLPKNATSEEDMRAKGTEAEFVESMGDYFKLKDKYEKKAISDRYEARENALKRGLGEKQARKIARELRPKCINCKRPVGTVFKMQEDRLLAYCADTKSPCPLKIEIFKGRFESDDRFANSTAKSLLEVKENIIRQKMDVLFNYASEEETVSKFKELIEEYNILSFLHKTDIEIRDDKQFNIHKQELIKTKLKKIEEIKASMNVHMEEYQFSGNNDELTTAMDIYIREYMPEINNLRMMKYGVMEMIVPGTNGDTQVRALNQGFASMRQLETLHGEVPKILKYVTGSGQQKSRMEMSEEGEYEDGGEEE